MRAWKIAVPVVAVVALGGWFAQRKAGTFAAETNIPTARVRQGNLRLDVRTTGELQTGQNVTLFAPPVAGGTLQIVHLASDGTQVKAGDVVLQFDPSEQEYNLEKNRSDLEQGEQEMAKAKAQADVQNSDDRLALLKAKFAVREAELQVQKNPLLAAIDAKKNVLALDQAKRTLAQLEQDIQSHASSNQAALQVAQAKYNKAKIEMQRAEDNIKNMTIRAPIAGVVKVLENRAAVGGFFFTGMTVPEFRNGDQAQPGTPIASILDMQQMTILGKITETDRPSVRTGEPVEIQVDAIPGKVFPGKVKTVAGMAVQTMFEANPTRRFDMSVEFDHADRRLRPGFTAHLTLRGEEVKDALYVPRVAVFEKNGKSFVYVRGHNNFTSHDVKITAQSSAWAVIEGLKQDDEVALVNPAGQSRTKASTPAGPAVQGGGR
jgi:HlyD family secretion protein